MNPSSIQQLLVLVFGFIPSTLLFKTNDHLQNVRIELMLEVLSKLKVF